MWVFNQDSIFASHYPFKAKILFRRNGGVRLNNLIYLFNFSNKNNIVKLYSLHMDFKIQVTFIGTHLKMEIRLFILGWNHGAMEGILLIYFLKVDSLCSTKNENIDFHLGVEGSCFICVFR